MQGRSGRSRGQAGRGHEKDLGDGLEAAAGDRVGGVGRGVELKQLAEDEAGARAGVLGQGQRLGLGVQGVVGVIGDKEGGLLGGRHLGRLGGRGVVSQQHALVGAVKLAPQAQAHEDGRGDEDAEEDGLVAGDHGCRPSVLHSSMAAARASAMRAW